MAPNDRELICINIFYGLEYNIKLDRSQEKISELILYYPKFPIIVIIIEDLGIHLAVYQGRSDRQRSLVAMPERTGMSVSQVTDEVLYTGLVEMQGL